ncbi:MAG: hypothetical protein WCF04_08670, partial [Candidatus Nanopelagicales bacterium]
METSDRVVGPCSPSACRRVVGARRVGPLLSNLFRTGRLRTGLLGTTLLGAGLLLAGCVSVPPASVVAPDGAALVLPAATAAELAIEASQAVWETSPVAVTVADPAEADLAAKAARDLQSPAFLLEDVAAPALEEELDRLGVTHVLHVGSGAVPRLRSVDVVTAAGDLPERSRPTPLQGVLAVTAPDASPVGAAVAAGTLAAAGAKVLGLG